MKNIKKALTALAATAVLAPTLVACGQRNLVQVTNNLGGEMLVDCAAGKVSIVGEDRLKGFHTPKNLGREAVKVGEREGNPFANLAGPLMMGYAQEAIDTACASNVNLSEPNEDGIRFIEAKKVTLGQTGAYQDGITISVRKVWQFDSFQSKNMFAKRVYAGDGHVLIVVALNVSNNGNAPATLNGRNFQLKTGDGRTFNPITTDMNVEMWVDESFPQDVETWTSINPGSSNSETLVFRVPNDVKGGADVVDRTVYAFDLA